MYIRTWSGGNRKKDKVILVMEGKHMVGVAYTHDSYWMDFEWLGSHKFVINNSGSPLQ